MEIYKEQKKAEEKIVSIRKEKLQIHLILNKHGEGSLLWF